MISIDIIQTIGSVAAGGRLTLLRRSHRLTSSQTRSFDQSRGGRFDGRHIAHSFATRGSNFELVKR